MLTRSAFASSAFVLFALCAVGTTQGQSGPVPFLSEPLVPTSVAPGGPALTLTVHGTGFTSLSVVKWNGVALQTSYVSSSQLKVTVPAANTAHAGTASITVSTSNGVASNAEFFFISKPTSPAFTSYHISIPPLQSTSGLQWPVVADVNGDGKLDLVGGFLNQMAVLLGNGDGSFQTPSFFPLLGGAGSIILPAATVTGDFNGDGKPDFAFSFGSFNTNVLVVVLGHGDGTFGSPASIALPANYVGNFLYTADVNGDGKLDLISGNNLATPSGGEADGTFSVFLGNGDGTFMSPVNYQIGSPSYLGSMAIGDVNNDGKLDVIAGTSGNDLLFLGNGDGTFASPISSQDVGPGEQWLLADLNGDDNLDVVALGAGQLGSMNTYLGSGTGGFTSAGSYGTGVASPASLTIADINADGKLDSVVPTGNSPSPAIGILVGNGDGTFGQPTTYPTESTSSFGGVAADFNGDGMPDLFFGSDTAPTVGLGFVLLQGSFPELTSTPTSITFAQQQISTTSAAQSVTLTNSGKAALAISKVAISGVNATDYAETNTCGATLAVNDSCQVSITFTPTAQGTRTGGLSVTDNAPGSPQAIGLTGQTTPAPALILSASSLTFPGQYVGTSGLPQTITVTNTGDATLTISAVSASTGDFGVLNACGGSLAAGSSCSIGVFFDPTASGARSGTLTIADDAAGSPQSVTLSGSGEDFSISASSSSASVNPGQTATYMIGLSGVGGFSQSVTLSCSGAPAGSTCSLSSPSVMLSSSTTPVTVSVTTVAASLSKGPHAAISALPREPILYFSFCAFPGWLLFLRTRKRTHKAFQVFLALVFIATVTAALNGCGGGKAGTGGNGSGGTPPMTYTLTVTGTFASSGASLSHSTGLTLTVE
jgi:FG-GAP-like repeat/Abnormal spindle-like microcephaly-assoc'd, ASPM-SPD-2-Hydin